MREDLKSDKLKELESKHKKHRLRVSFLLFILFVSIFGFLSYFSYHPFVSLNTIEVKGNHVIYEEDIRSIIKKELDASYFRLFSRANTFIYPKNKIQKTLLETLPRIESVEVNKIGLNTLSVAISEKTGAFLYCGISVPEIVLDVGENCYFINNDGYVFDKAPYYSGNVYFKFYIPNMKDSSILGSSIMPSFEFYKIVNFIDGIEDLGFNPIYIYLDEDGVYHLSLEKGISSTPVILFNKDNDLRVILENLSLAMAKSEFSNEIKSKYDNLLYIDLRFDNKVLYKFNE